ncbi:hypothetical protein [Geomonas subterranea]|uniref:hypothetical protein n=1 Tax=Geomonas subterranea TaxID=2847989 RepID=UPI001CD2FF3F|nr:hypothetical protein [Geomonas fuzhouensis]
MENTTPNDSLPTQAFHAAHTVRHADVNEHQVEGNDSDEIVGSSQEIALVPPVINQDDVARIMSAVTKATASPFFMSNPKRLKKLEEAMVIPVSDDKSFQMFHISVAKDLECAASKEARKLGVVPAEVTEAQIMIEAQNRYIAKHGIPAIVNEEYLA